MGKDAKRKKNVKISACMMVKNEEKMLPRCLNSIKHLVDEIIVVDTGSSDKTIEIANSFGAKIYHHPWENDFSKHRNLSFSYATGDWIIYIDADEELNAYDLTKKKLKKTFFNTPKEVHCFLIKMSDKNKDNKVVSSTQMARIFRNNVGVEFRGIVHNTAYYTGQTSIIDLEFFHYGYALSDEQMQAKYKRTSGLLLKRVEKDPLDCNAYFYLFQVYMEMGKPEDAIQYASQCLDILSHERKSEAEASFYYSLYHGIANAHIKTGRPEKAEEFIRRGLEVIPEEVDLYYDLAAVGYFTNNPDLTVEGAENYFRVVNEFRTDASRAGTRFVFSTSREVETTMAFWLMLAYISLGRFNDFSGIWELHKEYIVDKTSFQTKLFSVLEEKEAFDALEQMAVFLYGVLDKITAENQKVIFSHLMFCLRERRCGQYAEDEKQGKMFAEVIEHYLDMAGSYDIIPPFYAVIIAEFLLKQNLSDYFLDLTLSLFERELEGKFKVIDTKETVVKGYNLIAEKQGDKRKGVLTVLVCKNIASILTNTKIIHGNIEEKMEEVGELSMGKEKGCKTKTYHQRKIIPRVSIGLPVYNGGNDLKNAIESILNQDYEDFELIISDNCSTDITEDICRKYAKEDSRINYIRLDRNYGLLLNWQNVAGRAIGEFFVFAQHDNTFLPGFLSACLNTFIEYENEPLGIVFPRINIFDGTGNYTPYSDPLNAVHEDPIQRYLHVLRKMDLNNAVLGMMRPDILKSNKTFYGSSSTQILYGDHPMMSEIALNGKIKQIDKRLLNRQMSDYKVGNMAERNVKLINAAGVHLLYDGISLPFIGIIRKQMEVIKYASISFKQKNFLIEETIEALKLRFNAQMLLEINRAVNLVKKRHFFCTWDGKKMAETEMNKLKYFKYEYMTNLYRELESALSIYPDQDGLRDAVEICDQCRKA